MVKKATRGKALLDKIVTNIHQFYTEPEISAPVGLSDHNVLIVHPESQFKSLRPKLIYRQIRVTSPNAKALVAHDIMNLKWENLYRMDCCSKQIDYFYTTLRFIIDKHMPIKTIKRFNTDRPWVTDYYLDLIKQRQKAFVSKNLTDFNKLRNKINRLSKSLKSKYFQKKMENISSNKKEWWKCTDTILNKSHSSGNLQSLVNNLYGGNNLKAANAINQHFLSICKDLMPLDITTIPPPPEFIPDTFIIRKEEVEKKLLKINIHKSPGPDEIPNWLLRDFATYLSGPVCSIFNSSIRESYVPDIWKSANVIAIPKTQPAKSIENDLRPISLTPVITKHLESIIGSWIWQKARQHVTQDQYGGIKGSSCTLALLDMLHFWHAASDKGETVRILLLDYSKAFDHVDHTILINKLKVIGIHDIIIRWIAAFLYNRHQRVILNGATSEWGRLIGSVPQGSWLGPLLFIIHISDLEPKSRTHKFMDDTTISEAYKCIKDSVLQVDADSVVQWSKENNMIINARKTKEMIIDFRKDYVSPEALSIEDEDIVQVDCAKLLGIYITNDLSWKKHVQYITGNASKRLYFLKFLRRTGIGKD